MQQLDGRINIQILGVKGLIGYKTAWYMLVFFFFLIL